MFKKLLLKALKNLKPEEKKKFRELLEEETETQEESVEELVDENKSEETENKENLEKEPIDMPDENVIKDDNKVETPTNSSENDEKATNNVAEEQKTQENGVEKEENKEQNLENKENAPVQEDAQPQVQETDTAGNGTRVEDLVTKDELMEKLAAFEAKYDALLKENQDLKDKYENKDFGGYQRQGMVPKDKELNQSFEEYSKNFM